MAGDPRKVAAGAAATAATMEPEQSAKCPKCGSDHVHVLPGGAARCGACGARLTENVDDKTHRSAGYEAYDEPATSADVERGLR